MMLFIATDLFVAARWYSRAWRCACRPSDHWDQLTERGGRTTWKDSQYARFSCRRGKSQINKAVKYKRREECKTYCCILDTQVCPTSFKEQRFLNTQKTCGILHKAGPVFLICKLAQTYGLYSNIDGSVSKIRSKKAFNCQYFLYIVFAMNDIISCFGEGNVRGTLSSSQSFFVYFIPELNMFKPSSLLWSYNDFLLHVFRFTWRRCLRRYSGWSQDKTHRTSSDPGCCCCIVSSSYYHRIIIIKSSVWCIVTT